MTDQWNTTTVDPSQAPEPLSPQVLSENLGHTSQFVGLMDTEDKVRGHLDAVAQYQTVYSNLLHSGQFDHDEIKRAYCSTWVACEGCESPHGACVDVCAKAGRVVETFGFGPDMDAALAEDDAKLVALGAYDGVTEQVREIAGHLAQSVADHAAESVDWAVGHKAPAPAAQGCTHHALCRSLFVATAHQGCDCAARGMDDWAGGNVRVESNHPAIAASELEAARVAWKDAVAKRNALMAQWDAYVGQCRDHYQRLKRGQ